MLPDRVSNPGPLTYESDALPIALCGPGVKEIYFYYKVKGWAILTHYPELSFSYIKPSSRYMAKSLDHEIEVTVKHGCMES